MCIRDRATAAQPPRQLEAVPLTLQQALHILPHLHLSEAGSVVLPHRLLLLAQTLPQVLLFLDLPLVQLPVEQKHIERLTVMTSTTQRVGTPINQREGTELSVEQNQTESDHKVMTSTTRREGTSITQRKRTNVRRASGTAPCGTESDRAVNSDDLNHSKGGNKCQLTLTVNIHYWIVYLGDIFLFLVINHLNSMNVIEIHN